MPDCNYCTESFEDEDAYLTHLRTEHVDELGPIDRRRVGTPDDDGGISAFPVAAGVSLLAVGAVVVYVSFFMNSADGSAGTAEGGPSNLGSAHYHGPMTMVVEGNRVDFSQSQYQLQDNAFHFEGDSGRQWHVHAQGVTLEYAMSTLGIDVSQRRVAFDGTTYRDTASNTTATVRVNGESVTPSEYVLQRGDAIRIVVR